MEKHSGLFGLWLRFGSVIPIWIGTPSPKLRPKSKLDLPSKILAPHGHSFSLIALTAR